MKIFGLAIAQIRHKPIMAILPILLFTLGIGLLLLMTRIDERLSDTLERNLAGVHLVIGAKGSPLQLVLSSLYHADNPTGNIALSDIRSYLNPKHPIIKSVLPISSGDNYKGYRLVGSDPGILDWYGATLARGQNFQQPLEVVAGSQAAKELNITIGDQFASTHGLDAASDHQHEDQYRVVGILNNTGTILDRLLLTTVSSYWQTHDHSHTNEDHEDHSDQKIEEHAHKHGDHEHVHNDHIHAHDDHNGHNHESHEDHEHHNHHTSWTEGENDKTITSLLVRYRGMNHMALNFARSINENTPLQAAAPNIEIGRLYALTGNTLKVARYVSYIIMLVSALSLFIALYSVLQARMKELALLRSLGARRSALFGLIITEGLVVALIGILGGIFLSRVLEGIISRNIGALGPIDSWINAENYIVLVAVVIAILAAAIPAWSASQVQVADEL